MKEFIFKSQLALPCPIAEVFAFFANPENLEALTPPWLNFRLLTPLPITMQPGTLIRYRISVHGVPLSWQTQITEWQPPTRFVDVQLRGPYVIWEHTHTFQKQEEGTICADHVRYRPRGGSLLQWLFVRDDIEKIFHYRQQRLKELFQCSSQVT